MADKNLNIPDKPKVSELNMENEAALFASILKSCTEYSIIALNLESKIVAWNEGAHRLFHYEPGEMVNKAILSNIHDPEDIQSGKIQKILEELRQTGVWSGELKCYM